MNVHKSSYNILQYIILDYYLVNIIVLLQEINDKSGAAVTFCQGNRFQDRRVAGSIPDPRNNLCVSGSGA